MHCDSNDEDKPLLDLLEQMYPAWRIARVKNGYMVSPIGGQNVDAPVLFRMTAQELAAALADHDSGFG